MPDLLGSSDSEESASSNDDRGGTTKLVVNKAFAKSYQARKQRQDLRQLADNDDSDSEDDEPEDEVGTLLTTQLDTNIARTLHALRTKDARIYDPDVRFFESDDEDEEEDSKMTSSSHTPKRYKDIVREQVLAQMQELDNEDDNDTSQVPPKHRLAYNAEQEALRQSFLQSTVDSDNQNDLLVVKAKTTPSSSAQAAEEAAFVQEMDKLQKTTSTQTEDDYVDPKGQIDNGQQFLFNFFRERAWKQDDDDDSEEEGTDTHYGHPDERLDLKDGNDDEPASDEASLNQLDETDDFEAQYNFRFEQAAGSTSGADHSLKSYARQVETSLRRPDTKRAEQRAARKARKAAERLAQQEELKRLKNLKRAEYQSKLQQVKHVMGATDADADGVDEAAIMQLLQGDYDPDQFAQKMEDTFGDAYYAQTDTEWHTDQDVRAALRQDEDGDMLVGGAGNTDGDLYDAGNDAPEEANHEDYAEIEQEEPYQGYDDDEEEEAAAEETELERKLRTNMEDELYKLDYEDIVAGMPTRFKYRQVEANSYGLSTEEILFARDTTLKQYVSLKKMAPYRTEGEFRVGGKRRRRFREMVEHEIEQELEAEGDGNDEPAVEAEPAEEGPKKRKRRRVKKKKKTSFVDEGVTAGGDPNDVLAMDEPSFFSQAPSNADNMEQPTAPKRRRRKKKKSEAPPMEGAAASKDTQLSLEHSTHPANTNSAAAVLPAGQKKKKKKPSDGNKHHSFSHTGKPKKSIQVQGISQNRLASYGL